VRHARFFHVAPKQILTLTSYSPRTYEQASGLVTGAYSVLGHVDGNTAKRSYSASAYFAPNESRSNLLILTGAHATKLNLSGEKEPYVVESVSFTVDGTEGILEVKASKEIIVSAGAFGTPALLELSGANLNMWIKRWVLLLIMFV
jgi:choline dehydrogenase-like flavoprotein